MTVAGARPGRWPVHQNLTSSCTLRGCRQRNVFCVGSWRPQAACQEMPPSMRSPRRTVEAIVVGGGSGRWQRQSDRVSHRDVSACVCVCGGPRSVAELQVVQHVVCRRGTKQCMHAFAADCTCCLLLVTAPSVQKNSYINIYAAGYCSVNET